MARFCIKISKKIKKNSGTTIYNYINVVNIGLSKQVYAYCLHKISDCKY